MTIPCGLSPEGMPIGLQLVGPPNSEPQLLSDRGLVRADSGFQAAPPE